MPGRASPLRRTRGQVGQQASEGIRRHIQIGTFLRFPPRQLRQARLHQLRHAGEAKGDRPHRGT